MPVPVSLTVSSTYRPGRQLGADPGIVFADELVGRLDGEPAAVGHRVPRVDHQVHDHLLELARVGVHRAELRLQRRHQRDVLADEPRQHPLEVGDTVVEVDRLGLADLPPAEGEDLAGERGGALATPCGSPRGPRAAGRRARGPAAAGWRSPGWR